MERRTRSNRKLRSAVRRDGWQARLPHAPRSDPYYDWLVHVGSLTARLRARCGGLRVVLVRQELARPGRDERAVLNLRRGELAWVRDVVLLCGGRPAVYAHSVLPRRSVRGAWHLFAGLGTRPLGAILFDDPLIERRPFAYRELDARDGLYREATAALRAAEAVPRQLWARRSAFCRGGKPILVTEIFLPEILKLRP